MVLFEIIITSDVMLLRTAEINALISCQKMTDVYSLQWMGTLEFLKEN